MPRIALAGLAVYFILCFGLRSGIHWRRTGSTGMKGISGPVGSAEWFGGVAFALALGAAVLAPVAELAGWLTPLPLLDGRWARAGGLLLGAAGTAATLGSQMAMGDAWRVGVDPRERTALVARGPFRWVRNPIFTSMAVALGGFALLTPNTVAGIALALLLAALQLQVRRVEEPSLLRAHGERYRRYAAHTGRFLPGLGRLPESV